MGSHPLNPLTPQPELQIGTLTLYGELVCRALSWPGQLVYSAFPGAARTGLSAASSLAGAASLVVDSDAASVHASNRDGGFDFVVNSLDEALRTLKNEIRLRRPLSVALIADPHLVTEAAAARGLAPRLILSGPEAPPLIDTPSEKEVHHIRWSRTPAPSPALIEWLADRNWSALPIASLQPATAGQSFYADMLGAEDQIRSNWLRGLSRHQRSVRHAPVFWAWMTPQEQQAVAPGAAL